MPIYEFRCSECDAVFEEKRGADMANAPAPACPNGHAATRRILSVFATVATTGDRAGESSASAAPVRTGGGCGPGCACAH